MSKNFMVRVVLFAVLSILAAALVTVYADSSSTTISGRLAAKYDSSNETVTAMVAGYCEGEPVTIGPSTWKIAGGEFSQMKAEDIGKTLCGKNLFLKKVTKSANNGKEIVADVVIEKPKPLTKVER